MRYLGGKARLSKRIAASILDLRGDRDWYFEPFLGGGAVAERVAASFHTVILSDSHADLIAMWQAAARGWVPPTDITLEDYAAARRSYRAGEPATALRGFIGFGCSFGGKWFGGYARHGEGRTDRDCALQGSDVVARAGGAFSKAHILCADYASVDILGAGGPRAVVYADPPYQGTTGYAGGVEYDTFWATMERWADAGSLVLVSEYSAPPGWRVLWEQQHAVNVGRNNQVVHSQERLYIREDLL